VIAYVDASVLLRLALGQVESLAEWSKINRGVASALVTTESLRTLDRLRVPVKFADSEFAERRAKILELIASLELVDIDSVVLDRAAQPMPTELGTLDAIHGSGGTHGTLAGRSPFATARRSRSGPRLRASPMTRSASLTTTASPAVKSSGATPACASGASNDFANPSPLPALRSSASTVDGAVNPSARATVS
jgi:predicted nucleic acid-binding protein